MSDGHRPGPAPLYPVHLRLVGRLCVVVGGGHVAERKVQGLVIARATTRVVAITATSELRRRGEVGEIELILRAYDKILLQGAALVIAATNRRDINARVARDASELGAWANVADAPEDGDFVTPAVVRRGDLLLSIGTGGNQPMLASRIASELEARFGTEYSAFVALLGRMRDEVKARTEDAAVRRSAYAALLDHEAELRSRLLHGDTVGAVAQARTIVTAALGEPAPRPLP